MPLTRVCALQFAVTDDVAANLATCLRLIDQAAHVRPALIVTPEFINHILWFEDAAHCWAVSVDLEGAFLHAIGAKAHAYGCYIKVNCTVRRAAGQVTGTNILFDPHGAQIAVNDKQILMGNENNFLTPATAPAQIVQTPFGALGMYCCMDGVIPEPARALAVRGAQILLNSLNSFASDEAALHIPVRAGENKVYVVAANKVGGLVPPHMAQVVAARLKIPAEAIAGAGESQILAPDGTVLAKAPKTGEAVIYADIDVEMAAHKLRPDGTDMLRARRPDIYAPLATPSAPRLTAPGAARLEVAVYQPQGALAETLRAITEAIAQGVQLIALPELFHLGAIDDRACATHASNRMIEAVREALKDSEAMVAASVVNGPTHEGVLIGRAGVCLRQPQLHACGRHPWATHLGHAVNVLDLPWGRIALVVGGDAIYPEVFRLAVLQDVDVVVVPTKILETWEGATGLLERAAENRMNLVAATVPSAAGTSLIAALDKDFTLWTQWEKAFDGNINFPVVTRAPQAPGLTRASVFPACAANRMISQKTNVVENRPWWLLKGVLTE